MTISILYFARYREALNCDKENFALEDNIKTVDDLINTLSIRGDIWKRVLNEEKVLIAVNQTISNRSSAINEGDEVAFFPPVTGG
ncbi:MAG: molybdopterin converting factor subunit 1 [Cellvibrionaceae bacterium]